jgi:hypothetical protein
MIPTAWTAPLNFLLIRRHLISDCVFFYFTLLHKGPSRADGNALREKPKGGILFLETKIGYARSPRVTEATSTRPAPAVPARAPPSPPRLATSGHTCFAPPLREDLNSVRSPLPHGTENHLEGIALAPLQRLLPCLLSTSSPRLVRHRHRLPQTSRNARWPRQVYRRLKNRARVLTCDHPASLAERLPRFVRVGAGGQGSASRSPITF